MCTCGSHTWFWFSLCRLYPWLLGTKWKLCTLKQHTIRIVARSTRRMALTHEPRYLAQTKDRRRQWQTKQIDLWSSRNEYKWCAMHKTNSLSFLGSSQAAHNFIFQCKWNDEMCTHYGHRRRRRLMIRNHCTFQTFRRNRTPRILHEIHRICLFECVSNGVVIVAFEVIVILHSLCFPRSSSTASLLCLDDVSSWKSDRHAAANQVQFVWISQKWIAVSKIPTSFTWNFVVETGLVWTRWKLYAECNFWCQTCSVSGHRKE